MKTPIVILGIGKSGQAAKNLLLAQGFESCTIHTFDEKNSAADFSHWDQIKSLEIGTLVLSPGIPMLSPGLVQLKAMGWQVTSEINLACSILTDEIIVGITGSVGKSTVTSLLGEAVEHDDPCAFVGGNLGIPFCEYALQVINKEKKARYIILELSSYQLENCKDLKLNYSAITFLSSNHLERYATISDYYKTKCNIGSLTKHQCLLNESSVDLINYKNFILCETETVNYKSSTKKDYLEKSQLTGEHNLDNLALALSLANKLNLSFDAINKMISYKGLNHRLETVGYFNGILYINDSKATAMDSVLVATRAALTKVNSDKNLYLLLGGKDKNLPWFELNILKLIPNLKILFFGQCGETAKIKSELTGNYYSKLGLALDAVFKLVKTGDVVLLSPGGTSLDEFKNFEDRGNIFKELVIKNYD